MGSALHGAGFILTPDQAQELAQYGQSVIRPYLGGRDLLQVRRERYVIDFSGLSRDEALAANPHAFQHVMDHVKPERDHNRRSSIRELWWRFGWERPKLRAALAGTFRFIGTTETAKHRVFQFIDSTYVADHMIVCAALSDAYVLGCLSSRLHGIWAFAAGGTLEDRPRYNKNVCFETFPLPATTPEKEEMIRTLAEGLDTHRKRQQAEFPAITLTGMYNVLEKLRAGNELTASEKTIHTQGLVSLLRELHDKLDRAVLAAYGWDDLAERLIGKPGATTPLSEKSEEQAVAEEEVLLRLVDLNTQRAAEEAQGHVRWLRPDFQNPSATGSEQHQPQIDLGEDETATPVPPKGKATWPKSMREQVAAVRAVLLRSALPAEDIAERFKRSPLAAVQSVLDALQDLGLAEFDGRSYRIRS